MKNFLTLFFSLLLLNCNSDKSNSFDHRNQTSFKVGFLEQNFNFPKNYKKITGDDLLEKLKDSTNYNELPDYEHLRVKSLKRMGRHVEFFADENNYRNIICFHPANYIKMSKEALELYMDLLENNMFPDSEENGIYYKRLEGGFSDYGLAEIVKVKYLQTFDEAYNIDNIYFTHYLISNSNNQNSFGIIVINEDDKDFQSMLEKYKL